jgi:hypothetical protein
MVIYKVINLDQTAMKVLVTICILALMCGCRKEQENVPQETPDSISFLTPSEIIQYHLDTVEFRPIILDTCNLKLSEISIGGTDGPTNTWRVTLYFYNSLRIQNPNFFWFGFFDKNNYPDNFSKKGLHLGTGWINDGLQYHTFSWGPMTSDEMEYYLDKALVKSDISHNFELEGSGYVKIKKRIYWKWPKRVWNGEKYILPGDSLYLSYGNPIYYEPATILINNIK